MTKSFSTISYLIRAGRIFCCRKKEKLKSKNMVEKTFILSQALDYLDGLEANSDSKEENLSPASTQFR